MKFSKMIGVLSFSTVLLLAGCTPSDQTAVSDSGDQTWVATKNTTRINTSDPYMAAVNVSKTIWPATEDYNRPGGVVLVNPEEWQTALASADLIHHPNNGPVLYVKKDSIPEVTLNELKRLKPLGAESNNGVQAILVGNIDPKVEEQVKDLGLKTDRIQAQNAADYAKAIDAYYAKVAGTVPESVIVASEERAEYTVPAVNWIAHMPEPLLYVQKNKVPVETVDALKTRNGKANIYILGPQSVVAASVEEELKQYGRVVRISGEDPYANAIAFAKYKDSATQVGWGINAPGHNLSFVAMDSDPALAIAAAPFSHLGKHAPLLFTDQKSMPESVMSYVMSIQPKYTQSPTEGPYNHAFLTGDEKALSYVSQGEIDAMLEIVSATGAGHGGMGDGTPSKGSQDSGGGNAHEGMNH